jgi:hypothetical protein
METGRGSKVGVVKLGDNSASKWLRKEKVVKAS